MADIYNSATIHSNSSAYVLRRDIENIIKRAAEPTAIQTFALPRKIAPPYKSNKVLLKESNTLSNRQ